MRNLLLLLMFTALVLCEILEKAENGIVTLNEETFEAVIEGDELVMVKFYAPWCGHCQALEPEYIAAAKIIADQNLNVIMAEVDVSEETYVANEYKISGVPALKLFRRKKALDFQGPNTAQGIADWLKKKANISVKKINTVNEAKEFASSNEVFALGLFKDLRSKAAQEYLAVAQDLDEIAFAISDSAAVYTEYGVSASAVLVVKSSKETPNAVFTGPMKHEAIKNFVHIESLPLVIELKQENVQKIFSGPVSARLLMLGNGLQVKKMAENVREIAKQYKGKMIFLSVDTDNQHSHLVLKFLGIKQNELPTMRIINMDHSEKEILKYQPKNPKFTIENIRNFARAFFKENLKPYFASEEIPANWDKKLVKILVSINFDSVAFDENKDVLVMFHVPWCGHCQKLASILDELARKYKNRKSLVFAKIDVSANELEHTKIRRYPTIKLYKKGENEVEEYESELTLGGLIEFLEDNNAIENYEAYNPRDNIEL